MNDEIVLEKLKNIETVPKGRRRCYFRFSSDTFLGSFWRIFSTFLLLFKKICDVMLQSGINILLEIIFGKILGNIDVIII